MLSYLKLLLNNLKLFNVKIDDQTCFQENMFSRRLLWDKMKKIIHMHVGKQIHIFNFRHWRI